MFLDESGFLLQPLRKRVWAPCGQTPVRYPWARHDRLSVISALTVAPKALRFGLYYEILDHNCRTSDFLRFIQSVHRQLQRSMILVWDRLSAHCSAAAQLECTGSSWFESHFLPSYAPELDPVEFVWTQAKYHDLANWLPNNREELRLHLQTLLEQYRDNPDRLNSFFRIARLPIY
jgi:transposase